METRKIPFSLLMKLTYLLTSFRPNEYLINTRFVVQIKQLEISLELRKFITTTIKYP